MPVGTGSWRHNRVAGAGIAPTPGGYACHDNFRCSLWIRDLDYAFDPVGRLPSSLYTFPAPVSRNEISFPKTGAGLGSALPCVFTREGFTEFGR